jgi:EAL domain-containing protein (putative c-di-GMP-specific phosphodiesterase class I)
VESQGPVRVKEIGADWRPGAVTSPNHQPPSGVLRLLVSDTGRVDGIDALGSAIGVPQLGAALITGYHPEDVEAVSAHLGALVARAGAVAHWDARVRHRGDWVWVYEYGIARGHGAIDVVRVFPGRGDPAGHARAPDAADERATDAASQVLIVISREAGALQRALPAVVVEAVLGKWIGVLDEWSRAADGGYLAWMQHCGLPQAEAVARELQAALRTALGAEADGLSVRVRPHDGSAVSDGTSRTTPGSAAAATTSATHVLHDYTSGLLPALAEQRLLLHLQPIARLGSGTDEALVAAEFLLRVRSRDGHAERPGLRLLETERHGAMHRIDRWVVTRAFNLLAEQASALKQLEFVTVNLSGPSLGQADMLAHVLRQFLETGVDPAKICFEITETAAIPDIGEACMFIEALQRRGCRFAIDDFGAGLASFHLLRVLPVDLLKLDGRLFREPIRQMALLHQLQYLGHSLGKLTVAEHIESESVCAAVRQVGVDYAQGHFFGEPEPPESFFRRLS